MRLRLGVHRGAEGSDTGLAQQQKNQSTKLKQRPCIGVLPFAAFGEDRDQSYRSSEEVIDRLAQVPKLRVIARTSAFGLKKPTRSLLTSDTS